MTVATASYSLGLDVDVPVPQGRLSVLLRIFYVIPHLIVLSFLFLAFAIAWFLSWPMILATGTYPQGMLDFSLGIWRWTTRVGGYANLLTDKYPPFTMNEDPNYPVRMTVTPQVEGRNRITTFWIIREIMAIPHVLALVVFGIAMWFVVLIAWVVALVMGEVPEGFHNFIAGVLRWNVRVGGYIYNLQDQYPPFSMA